VRYVKNFVSAENGSNHTPNSIIFKENTILGEGEGTQLAQPRHNMKGVHSTPHCDMSGQYFSGQNLELCYISRSLSYWYFITIRNCVCPIHPAFHCIQGHVLLVHQRACSPLVIAGFLVILSFTLSLVLVACMSNVL